MTASNFKVLIVLGKSGSGKGTQVEALSQRYNLRVISSGSMLRTRAQEGDFVGKRIGEILDKGGLIPTPLIFHMWLHELEAARENSSIGGIVFEGSPRKLYEAWMLDETLQFYDLGASVRALYLNISDDEAVRRLLNRARNDDNEEAIRNRLQWFSEEVMPAVDYYKNNGVLIEINGEQSIEDVNSEVVSKTDNFLK